MKTFATIIILALIGFGALSAHAGTTCTMIGSTVVCTDTGGGIPTTCTMIGGTMVCG